MKSSLKPLEGNRTLEDHANLRNTEDEVLMEPYQSAVMKSSVVTARNTITYDANDVISALGTSAAE